MCDEGSVAVHAGDLRVARSAGRGGGLAVGIGVRLADEYLEFLGGRCRPNTVLAAAYDLKVFCTVVGKPPQKVGPADVLAFITAQRAGQADGRVVLQVVDPGGEGAGVSAATVRRRLSIVSGFFAFLQARGDVAANPVPRGLPTRRERSRPRQGVPLVRAGRDDALGLPTLVWLDPMGSLQSRIASYLVPVRTDRHGPLGRSRVLGASAARGR